MIKIINRFFDFLNISNGHFGLEICKNLIFIQSLLMNIQRSGTLPEEIFWRLVIAVNPNGHFSKSKAISFFQNALKRFSAVHFINLIIFGVFNRLFTFYFLLLFPLNAMVNILELIKIFVNFPNTLKVNHFQLAF